MFEEKTLLEEKFFRIVKEKFKCVINDLNKSNIWEFSKTRKIPSTKLNNNLLCSIDKAVSEHALSHLPKNMTDIALILQASQLTYESLSTTDIKPSSWKENINKKISNLQLSIDLLIKAKQFNNLSQAEYSKAKKIMRNNKLILEKPKDIEECITILNESASIYKKKLDIHAKRVAFRKENNNFELNRRAFYRHLDDIEITPHTVEIEKIKEYWSNMWLTNIPKNMYEDALNNGIDDLKISNENDSNFNKYLSEFLPSKENQMTFPSLAEFLEIIKFLPNWKASGCDGIFNFFIKKITSLHQHLYDIIKDLCINEREQQDWFYKGITYLIPKGTPTNGSDFRPITCMSNLYKLVTKCVTEVITLDVEKRSLLADNQLGTVRRVQGAKEQALLNICINKEHSNELKAMWIDVKKAFDSVDHRYLIKCIENLNFPKWILNFLKSIIKKWSIDIRNNNINILEKKIERGILQGDSLSPILFVLCIDPLSRWLNEKFPQIEVKCEDNYHTTNHLLFIDDLKLLAKDDIILYKMLNEVRKFFYSIGLEMNKDKSATNSIFCSNDAEMMKGSKGYKCLGIIEDKDSQPLEVT